MIEVAQKKQWIPLVRDEVKLRAFLLGDGWRLPTFEETRLLQFPTMTTPYWYADIINNPELDKGRINRRLLIPVRDLKDD